MTHTGRLAPNYGRSHVILPFTDSSTFSRLSDLFWTTKPVEIMCSVVHTPDDLTLSRICGAAERHSAFNTTLSPLHIHEAQSLTDARRRTDLHRTCMSRSIMLALLAAMNCAFAIVSACPGGGGYRRPPDTFFAIASEHYSLPADDVSMHTLARRWYSAPPY